MSDINIEKLAAFCKKKGLVYPSSEIYGGMAGFFDYGPLGTELKRNIKDSWWKFHVQSRDDIVGIDGSIITHPKVWEASGHVSSFVDVAVECKKCGSKSKLDRFEVGKVKCGKCDGEYVDKGEFNPMFTTQVGPIKKDSIKAYLRPETAQIMFVDFKQVVETSRLKLPFGIAQMGKAFRNEISPRNFLFRCREFEQMEIEYFIHPKNVNNCPFIAEVQDHEIIILSSDDQSQGKTKGTKMTIKQALDKQIIKTQWHAYWLALEHKWFISLGATPDNFRIRQHLKTEKSHYALDTWDLEYKFSFGWKELQGLANRTDYDLKQHMKHSKKKMTMYIQEDKERIVPYVVAEPSQGVDRAFLVFISDAYEDDKERGNIVLKLDPKLSPIKVAVFPLVNKDGVDDKAKQVYKEVKTCFNSFYDRSGSIGRRYARQDEVGTPYCVTVDYDTLKDNTVTIRDRDTTEQIRVKIKELRNVLWDLLNKKVLFKEVKK